VIWVERIVDKRLKIGARVLITGVAKFQAFTPSALFQSAYAAPPTDDRTFAAMTAYILG
jgi:hypothetical protein